MAQLQPTDEFLVNRSDITYTQEQGTLMANLETTDKLLVNRSDVTYTITGQELIDSVIDPLDLTVTLAPTTGYVGFPVTATAAVSGGKAPDGGYQFDYQWYLADDPSGTNASAIDGATFQSYEPVDSDIDEYLGCTVSTTDLFSNTATDTAYIGPIASLNSAPLIDSVVLTETGDGAARFTSQTFAYDTVMAVDGAPAPDYALKAKLSGSTFNFGVESDTITKVDAAGENVYTTDTIASIDVELRTNQSDWAANFLCIDEADDVTEVGWETAGDFYPEGAFDGNIITFNRGSKNASGKYGYGLFRPSTPITINSTIGINNGIYSYLKWTIELNGETVELEANNYNGDPDDSSQHYKWLTTNVFDGQTISTSNPLIIKTFNSGSSKQQNTTVNAISIDGALLIDNAFPIPDPDPDNGILAPVTTLTFPTDNNFDKFEVGDVVQVDDLLKGITSLDVEFPSSFSNNGYIAAVIVNGKMLTDWGQYPDNKDASTQINCGASSSNGTNQTQGWADGILGTTPNKANQTKWRPVPGSPATMTITWTNPVDIKTLSMFMSQGSADDVTVTMKSSGQALGTLALPYIPGANTFEEGKADIAAVSITAIDDTVPSITVDGGSWYGADGTGDASDGRYEPDQVWSAGVTKTNGNPGLPTLNNDPLSKAFDGDPEKASGLSTGISQVGWKVSFPSGSAVGVNELSYRSSPGTTGTSLEFTVVGVNPLQTATLSVPSGDADTRWFDIDTSGINEIDYVQCVPTGNQGNIYGIKFDGVLLVDSSIPGGQGDTDISKTEAYDSKLTVETSANLDTFIAADALVMVDDTGAVASYTPQTSEIASVANNVITYSDYAIDAVDWNPSFDGSITTYMAPVEINATTKWDYTPTAAYDTIKIYCAYTGVQTGTPSFKINNIECLDILEDYAGIGQYLDQDQLAAKGISSPLFSIEITVSDKFGNTALVNAIEINGTLLTDGDTRTLLTFNTPNPDLKYFQPGDNVGKSGGFAPVIYTGNGGTQSIDCGFSPSLVWIKGRSFGGAHMLFDAVRGVKKRLVSNQTLAEGTVEGVTSFDSDGFTLGNDADCNTNNSTLVAWCWDAGNTTVTNNDGTIESQVRSNGNFSVVKWTATGAGETVGHKLSKAPAFIIAKSTSDNGYSWAVYHQSIGDQTFLTLNSADAFDAGAVNYWSPGITNTTFGQGINNNTALNKGDMIAYCWAETPGVSSFGEYSGSNSTKALNFGFRPAFVLIKCSSEPGDWVMKTDETGDNQYLLANVTNAESTGYNCVFTNTGIELGGNYAFMNKAGFSYIYAAFAASNPIEVIDVDVAANTMTVDGGLWEGSDGSASGTWNQDQEWSSTATFTNFTTNISSGFDGDKNTYVRSGGTGTTGTIEFASSLGNGELVIWNNNNFSGDSEGYEVSVNDGTFQPWTPSSYSFNLGNITALKKITIKATGIPGWSAIEFAGKLLVDTSVSGGPVGETVVTGPAKSGVGTFVSTNGTDTMNIENSNNQWIDNTNRLGEEFFIKKIFTALNANDPAHVAMSQAISAAFAAFPQNAAARRTSIASSLYRLMAGETLTAEETAALTSTVITAVNAAEPFALDGYYPLYYTATAANAASSVGDHHTHDMDGETFYMPDGGTIYHGSYVVPEEEEISGY